MSEPVHISDVVMALYRGDPTERLPRIRYGQREEIGPGLRRAIWLRDGRCCSWCGSHGPDGLLELDHIIPWSAGGSDRSDNLRLLCPDCNAERSNYRSDSAIARVIPVAYSCTRCMRREAVERSDPDAGLVPIEVSDPVGAFCVVCKLAGISEREWTL